jgi:hypothetical protein
MEQQQEEYPPPPQRAPRRRQQQDRGEGSVVRLSDLGFSERDLFIMGLLALAAVCAMFVLSGGPHRAVGGSGGSHAASGAAGATGGDPFQIGGGGEGSSEPLLAERSSGSDISAEFGDVRKALAGGEAMLAERSSGSDISAEFGGVRKALAGEAMLAHSYGVMPLDSGVRHVYVAPPGVQPGTLRHPPPLLERLPGAGPGAVSITPASGGARAVSGGRSEAAHGSRDEHALADDRGATYHAWDASNYNVTDGIPRDEWKADKEDWPKIKAGTRVTMRKIATMFDKLLYSEVFPDIKAVPQGGGAFKVRDNKSGRCVVLERYYEYVAATMTAQLGGAVKQSMAWAQGSALQLGFDGIEKSMPALRTALLADCAGAPVYERGPDNAVRVVAGDKALGYAVTWPKDETELFSHTMKLAK